MFNNVLSRAENEKIANEVTRALESLRTEGKLPRGLRAWHLFALKERLKAEPSLPYELEFIIEGK